MSLAEALEHIQSMEKCTSVWAQVELKRQIRDRVIPIKWAESEGPKDKPNVVDIARSQFVLYSPGLAPGRVSLRPLLILRSAVLATWPRTGSKTDSVLENNNVSERRSTSDAVDERDESWMTLVEAIEHTRISEACDSLEALRQLKNEIRDGMMPISWGDSKGPVDFPDAKRLSTSQLLLIGPGIAPDEDAGRYRPFLVDRSAVERLWPLPGDTSPTPKGADTHSSRPKLQRTKHEPDEVRQAARDLYDGSPADRPPNKPIAEQMIRRALPGADRDTIRDVLMEPDIASRRRKPGNQRRR